MPSQCLSAQAMLHALVAASASDGGCPPSGGAIGKIGDGGELSLGRHGRTARVATDVPDVLNVAMVCNSHHLGPHGEVDNATPAEDCSQIPSASMPLVA